MTSSAPGWSDEKGLASLYQIRLSDFKQESFYLRHTCHLLFEGKSRHFWPMVKHQSSDSQGPIPFHCVHQSQIIPSTARLGDGLCVPCSWSLADWIPNRRIRLQEPLRAPPHSLLRSSLSAYFVAALEFLPENWILQRNQMGRNVSAAPWSPGSCWCPQSSGYTAALH